MMSNVARSDQPYVGYIATHFEGRVAFAAFHRDLDPPTFYFDYYDDFGKTKRNVAIGQEDNGKWGFFVGGEIQSFEEPSNYRKRRIADRLNQDLIQRYFDRIGFDISADEFWDSTSKAWLIWDDRSGRRSHPGREGVDPYGTFARWLPELEPPPQAGVTIRYQGGRAQVTHRPPKK
ncbi:hypothetical protein [Fuerstiella marisgermanici]|nr:hypothetical protein [Fuerstiella marisgermanici]